MVKLKTYRTVKDEVMTLDFLKSSDQSPCHNPWPLFCLFVFVYLFICLSFSPSPSLSGGELLFWVHLQIMLEFETNMIALETWNPKNKPTAKLPEFHLPEFQREWFRVNNRQDFLVLFWRTQSVSHRTCTDHYSKSRNVSFVPSSCL